MAITFDSNVAASYVDNATSLTFSHTCSGTNRILFVGASFRENAGGTAVTGIGATYNGVSMTIASNYYNSNLVRHVVFYLVNPATGANNVVVSASNTESRKSISAQSASFNGVDQTSPIDVVGSLATGASSSYSQSITSTVDNCFALMYGNNNTGASLTGGTNTTIVNQPEVAFAGCFIARSTSATTPAGSFPLAYTSSSGTSFTSMLSFKPFVTSTTNTNFLQFF